MTVPRTCGECLHKGPLPGREREPLPWLRGRLVCTLDKLTVIAQRPPPQWCRLQRRLGIDDRTPVVHPPIPQAARPPTFEQRATRFLAALDILSARTGEHVVSASIAPGAPPVESRLLTTDLVQAQIDHDVRLIGGAIVPTPMPPGHRYKLGMCGPADWRPVEIGAVA